MSGPLRRPSVRLVATDLDGTLLHSDGTVTDRTRRVIDELDRRGVLVVFVTGRPVRWMDALWPHVGDHGLAICSNGAVVWDVERHQVTVAGQEVTLPLKEFELLEMLLRNTGRVLTRGQLIDRVWGSDYVGDTKTLDVHVKRLRAKIEPDPHQPVHLVTVRGLGYKLEA